MNKVVLMGRLTRDPEIRYSSGPQNTAIARFTLAVGRRARSSDGNRETDFLDCTAFGKLGEFADKYLHQGIKVLLTGRIQNNIYTNREGRKVYSALIIAEEIEFAESKGTGDQAAGNAQRPAPAVPSSAGDGFLDVPEGISEDELPFN